MKLRRATREDADAIAEVFIPSFRTLPFLPELHTPDEDREFICTHVVTNEEVWLAEEDERVLGFAALAGDVLERLYVHPDAHRRGVGSALLELVQGLRPGGFTFWVFQQNENARRFYEARGCRLVRLTDGSGNEERTPDALYEWVPGAMTEGASSHGGRTQP